MNKRLYIQLSDYKKHYLLIQVELNLIQYLYLEWADIEDDEDNNSPQVNTYADQQYIVEYKLQPTGETNTTNENRYHNKRPMKKPLLTPDEMIEQINNEKSYKVYIHCFQVDSNATKFREAFENKVRFSNVIESKNSDRDNSIDLKFDEREEAIKFIQLAQTTTLNGKTFRIKFGKLKQNDNFRKSEYKGEYKGEQKREHRGEYKGEYKPRNGQNERREHRGGENHQFKPRDGERQHGKYENRERGEYKPYHKRENHHEKNIEEKPVEKKEDIIQQNSVEQTPSEPFKPRGFINTKKDTNTSQMNNANEKIQCVDTNAKIIERQKREESERLAKQEEEKKETPQEQKSELNHQGQNGKEKRNDRSKGRNDRSKGRNNSNKGKHHSNKPANDERKNQKVIYEKKDNEKSLKHEQNKEQNQQVQVNTRSEDKSQGRKKLKLPSEDIVQDEWNIVGNRVPEKKVRNDDRKGRNDTKKNNNNKKPQVTYERKVEESK